MKPSSHAVHMQRSLELAALGLGHVQPNPLVGCVVVNKGRVVGEGYHRNFGGAHAEVNALRKAGSKAKGATLYVNLEPCDHHGKTPPCTEAIIHAGVRRVVAAMKDPNPLVSGKGFDRLRKAGVRVEIGVLKKEAAILNERFSAIFQTGRPFVGLKIAQSLDGYTADVHGKSKWITSRESRAIGHRLRMEYEAVLVGAGTVLADDPELTVRFRKGQNPIRIVIDGRLRVSPRSRVFNTKAARTILVTSLSSLRTKKRKCMILAGKGVEVIAIKGGLWIEPGHILSVLGKYGVSSILVEGGSETGSAFLQAGFIRRIHCFVAALILGGGTKSIVLENPPAIAKPFTVGSLRRSMPGHDTLLEGVVEYS